MTDFGIAENWRATTWTALRSSMLSPIEIISLLQSMMGSISVPAESSSDETSDSSTIGTKLSLMVPVLYISFTSWAKAAAFHTIGSLG
eukprot:CAMPEP_0178924538 /NCGR_PEP_ID=MMETSP0786-20121207/17388_1 /TAXON_ID=186022 /ORGANISM="Thalassionema frauenfeldii, Strain CCMP 1798" /LENGTH=87 /DNA_ID=CAMNT_0020599271 /DNA_START=276 /DNA_END=539 /DNA_ORIENTATION=-